MPTLSGTAKSVAQRSVWSPLALLRLIVWLALLGVAVAVLHGLGSGALQAPPHAPSAWSSWWAASDPVVASMALLRVVVLGLGWYLLVATLLGLIAHVSRSVALWRLAELVTARSMREVVAGLVGVALVSATSAPAAASPTLRPNESTTPVPIELVLRDAGERHAGASDTDASDTDARDVDEPGGEVGFELEEDVDEPGGELQRFRRRGGPLSGSTDLAPAVGGNLEAAPRADRDPGGLPHPRAGGTDGIDVDQSPASEGAEQGGSGRDEQGDSEGAEVVLRPAVPGSEQVAPEEGAAAGADQRERVGAPDADGASGSSDASGVDIGASTRDVAGATEDDVGAAEDDPGATEGRATAAEDDAATPREGVWASRHLRRFPGHASPRSEPRVEAQLGTGTDHVASPSLGPGSDEHIVEAGESFWKISRDRLARAGEPTDDRTVERYWRVLIEANLDRLVVEGEPDLILPGQRLRVPPLSPVTTTGVSP